MEGIVGDAFGGGDGKFVFENGVGDGGGLGVGHLHDRGDSASDGRAGFGMQVGLLLQPRIAAVDVAVDHAGQQGFAGRIDDRVGRLVGQGRSNVFNPTILDEQVGRAGGAFVDEIGIGD